MPNNNNDFFSAYLEAYGVPTKRSEVTQAAQQNQAKIQQLTEGAATNEIVGRDQGYGYDSADEVERDIRNLSPSQLEQKYGSEAAANLLQDRVRGDDLVQAAQSITRSPVEIGTDFAKGAFDAAVSGVGNIGAWGASYVDEDAGLYAARMIRDFSEGVRSTQSQAQNLNRQTTAAESQQAGRDRNKQFEADKKEYGNTVATLAREGRAFLDAAEINLSNPTATGDIVSQGVGSLLSGSAVGRGIAGLAGKKLSGRAAQASMALSIAAQEGGGAFQQTALEAYDLLADREDLTEDQRVSLATKAGQRAAEIQAPVSAVTGLLVAKFEANPLRFNADDAVKNITKETVEESLQSASGAVSSNVGIKEFADSSRDLTQGIGEQTATGAIGGFGSGGVVQVPGAAGAVAGKAAQATMFGATAVAKGAKAAARPLYEQILKRGDQILAARKKAGTVSDEEVGSSIAAMRDKLIELGELDEETSPEAEAEIVDLSNRIKFDPTEIDDSAPEVVKAAVEGKGTTFEAMVALAELQKTQEPGSPEYLSTARILTDLYRRNNDALENTDQPSIAALGAGKIREAHGAIMGAMAQIRDSETVKGAVDTAVNSLKSAAQSVADGVAKLRTPNETEILTPEGQETARNIVAAAEQAPGSVTPEQSERILEHAKNGRITLKPHQEKALRASSALVQQQRQFLEKKEAAGLTKAQDLVSAEVLTLKDNKTKQPSLAEHANRIVSAFRAGNTEIAAARLQDLLMFSQHMQNKLGALNEHYRNGEGRAENSVKFEGLNEARRFVPSNGPWVNAQVPNSVRAAQTIAAEARLVGEVANQMVDIFPELGLSPVELATLDTGLVGNVDEVVQKARSARPKTDNAPAREEKAKPSDQGPKSDAAPETKTQDPGEGKPSKDDDGRPARPDEGDDQLELPFDQQRAAQEAAEAEARAQRRIANTEKHGRRDARTGNRTEPPSFWSEAEQLSWFRGYEAERRALEAEAAREQDLAEAPVEVPNEETIPDEQEPAEEPTEAVDDEAAPEPDAETIELATEAYEEDRSLGNVFPRLIGLVEGGKFAANRFIQAFRQPKRQKSRLFWSSEPVAELREALLSAASYLSFTNDEKGSRKLTNDVIGAYEDYLGNAEPVADILDRRLQEAVKELGGEKSFPFLNTLARGRSLNITEETKDGLKYNQTLRDLAVLAGLQWMLVTPKFMIEKEDDRVAALLGLNLDEQSEVGSLVRANMNGLQARFNRGLTTVEATRSLAGLIRSYWGVEANEDADVADVEGIPEAMAKEVLQALVEIGAVEQTEPVLAVFNGKSPLENERSPYVFVPVPFNEKDPILSAPDMIERAILTEPSAKHHVGEAPAKVARTQHNNERTELTKPQRRALRNRQAVPYRLNLPFLSLVQKMGEEGVLKAFASGDISDENSFNAQHLETLKGRNMTYQAALSDVNALVAEMEAYAKANDMALEEVPTFFEYTFNRMNRLQMLGASNPQASKLMREILLPTWADLDLSNENSKTYQGFMVSVAQHLGVKVELMSAEDAVTEVTELLTGRKADGTLLNRNFSQSVAALQAMDDYTADGATGLPDGLIDTLKAELGGDMGPGAVHALMEYARLKSSTQEEKANFRTALYLEADGKTNGPVNALNIFTPGPYTVDWIRNAARGGLALAGQAKTLAQAGVVELGDLYQASANLLFQKMSDFRADLISKGNDNVVGQLDELSWLMDFALGKDVNFDGETLTFDRGVTKNPVTVTIYGSGARGIANKVSSLILEALYEKLSDVAQALDENPDANVASILFPNSANADADWARLSKALPELTGRRVVKNKEGNLFLVGSAADLNLDPVEFVLKGEALQNLEENVLQLFVTQMQGAINDVLGQPLMRTSRDIQRAIQSQSIVLQYAFRRAIDKKLAEKKAADPTRHKKETFLTRNELEEIWNSLAPLSPIVETGEQNFFIANSERGDTANSIFSRSLSGQLETPGFVEGPADAGVAGIPAMVIGSGDGFMMLDYALNGADRTQDVYDGLNMPVDAIEEFSRRANESVMRSWQRNPLQSLADAYTQFAEALDTREMTQEELTDLQHSLFDPPAWKKRATKALIKERVQRLAEVLQSKARSVEARHRALARVSFSVDQMASGSSPFFNEGEINLEGKSDDEIAEILNELMDEELAKIDAEHEYLASIEVSPVVDELGTQLPSGAYTMEGSVLEELAERLGATKWQQRLLKELVGPLSMKGYRVVFGSKRQLTAFATANGLPSNVTDGLYDNDRKVNGMTLPDRKLIMIESADPEVVVHEILHGATFDAVAAYYSGGFVSQEQEAAIKRIEALMDQFLGLDVEQESAETQEAYDDALTAIQGALQAGNPAVALNEFMAWGLTNKNLAELQGKTKATSLAQIAKDVVAAIRKLLFGGRSSSAVLDDMFTNLQFNTLVLANSYAVTGARSINAGTILYHSKAYGNSEHLKKVNTVFQRTVVNQIKESIRSGKDTYDKKRTANQWRKLFTSTDVVTKAVANGFDMDMQQKTTFQSIHAALMSITQFDANALDQAGALFDHVTKTLKVEDFIPEGEDTTGPARFYAAQKYDLVLGKMGLEIDAQGRSSLLPTFLALSIVSPEMRSVLAKLPLPKSAKNPAGTIDAMAENIGNAAMEKLGLLMSGRSKSEQNVKEAMDALADQIMKTAQERKSFYERFVGPVGNGIDAVNEKLTGAIQSAAEYSFDKAGKIKRSTNNSAVRVGAEVTRVVAAALNQKTANTLAEGWIGLLNKSAIPRDIQKLFVDMIGRTENNAPIYDLIKRVRNWVQQRRQQYREHLPELLAEKFSRKLEVREWQSLFRGMGKTDIAALRASMSFDQIIEMMGDQAKVTQEIQKLEQEIGQLHPDQQNLLLDKSKQLARFMLSGVPGSNLLRNAEAITMLLGESAGRTYSPGAGLSDKVDQLVTLYAMQGLDQKSKDDIARLASEEAEGLKFSLAFLEGLAKVEDGKRNQGMARYNAYKGYTPSEQISGGTLIVASDKRQAELEGMSFIRVGDYGGSNLERGAPKRGYYYAPVSTRAAYSQGLLQMVQQTVGGVDRISGLTHGRTVAGDIRDTVRVQRAFSGRHREVAQENLLPVYDNTGKIAAYERSVDPVMLEKIPHEEHLGKAMGIWAGRQVEEAESQQVNNLVLGRLFDMYMTDTRRSARNENQYVDLFDPEVLKKYPTLKDSMESMPGETLSQISSVFGDQFMVRKDMLDDALGYRKASVRDLWTGKSNWDPRVTAVAQDMLKKVFGNDAYRYMVRAEEITQNLVTDAKVLIVVKSVVVPGVNMLANIYQLWARGVPLNQISSGIPKKAAEVDAYLRTRQRLIDAQAELAAATTVGEQNKLKTEIQSIEDRHRRLSIWPLIDAGEFTSISDATVTHEELTLSQGRLSQYLETLVDKLPAGAQTAAKYGLVSRDTALFKGMQRTIEYGDFLAKAVLYDELTKRKGQSSEEALARITEEFVNYDRLPGRTRGYLEDIGLLWFWHFKIRSVKIALSMLRNNPLHVLLSQMAPQPDWFGSVGSPFDDNIIAMALEGRLDNSMGYDMLFRAPTLNPWFNLVT